MIYTAGSAAHDSFSACCRAGSALAQRNSTGMLRRQCVVLRTVTALTGVCNLTQHGCRSATLIGKDFSGEVSTHPVAISTGLSLPACGSPMSPTSVSLPQDLRRANFTSADIRNSQFKGANLQGAYLIKAVAFRVRPRQKPTLERNMFRDFNVQEAHTMPPSAPCTMA